jgi:hypothetical protein
MNARWAAGSGLTALLGSELTELSAPALAMDFVSRNIEKRIGSMSKRVTDRGLSAGMPAAVEPDGAGVPRPTFDDRSGSDEHNWRALFGSLFPSHAVRTSIGVCSIDDPASANTFIANMSTHVAGYLKSPALVVEAYRSQSSLADALGAASTPGLDELMELQGGDVYRCIHRTRCSKVCIIPFGRPLAVSNQPQLHLRYEQLYGMLPPGFRSVVTAVPPFSSAGDIRFPCSIFDRIVLAVRPHSVTSGTIRRTLDRLRVARASVAGVVWVSNGSLGL